MAKTINPVAEALEPKLPTDVASYVRAVFEQVERNNNEWGSTNSKAILQLQKKVHELEIEVANLKVNI